MILWHRNLAFMLVSLALSLGTVGVEANAASTTSDAKPKKRRVVKVTPAVERHANGETVADRERRLRRECKGRPNAGACLGFTN